MNISLLLEIWVFILIPALSTAMILTSPLFQSMVGITVSFMIDAIAFSLLSALSLTSWLVYSEPLPCWLSNLIFIYATSHFLILSYQMNKKTIINTSSNQEEDDQEISQKTDISCSSSLTPTLVANHKLCKCEEHEKCEAEEYWKLEKSKFIKEMNELRNEYIEDRREWEVDKDTLLEGLSAANKSVQLYRSLLHEFDQITSSEID